MSVSASILGLPIIVALGAFSVSNAYAQKSINVYSSRHYDVDKVLQKQFTAKTGIQVNEVQVKEASQLIERLKSEGERSPADVFLTVDVGNLWRAKDAGLLQAVQSSALNSSVPAMLRDPEGYWFGLTMRARAIIYNKIKVSKPKVRDYEDLAAPEYKGKVLTRTSSHVYNQSLVASLIHSRGISTAESWVTAITANLARKPEGNDTDQIKALAAGLGEYAIVNTYYVARLMKSKEAADQKIMESIGVIFPNQGNRGTHINVSGGGVTKSSKNKSEALAFLEFLVGGESQALLAEGNNEYPVRKDVPLDSVLKGFGKPKFDESALSVIGEKTPEAVKLLDRAGWR